MIPRNLRVLAILTLATVCSSSQVDSGWVLREDGIGPVKIGMTKVQLKAALHDKLSEDDAATENCYYLTPSKHPHVGFMMIGERVARIDVGDQSIPTSTGIRVGDSEARVKKIYGAALKIDPHQYIDDGHYLTVRSKNNKYGIRFETDKGKIAAFYAGAFEAIQYVEGCL